MSDPVREAFEERYKLHPLMRDENGYYISERMEQMWNDWEDAIASIPGGAEVLAGKATVCPDEPTEEMVLTTYKFISANGSLKAAIAASPHHRSKNREL